MPLSGSRTPAAVARCLGLLALALLALVAAPTRAEARWEWVEVEFNEQVEISGNSDDCEWGGGAEQLDLHKGAIRDIDIQSPDAGDRMDSDGDHEVQVYGVGTVREDDETKIGVSAIGKLKDKDKCEDAGKTRWEGSVDVQVTYERVEWVAGPTPAGPVRPAPCGNYTTRARNLQVVNVTCLAARALVQQYLNTVRSLGVHRLGAYACFDRAAPGGRIVSCQALGARSVYFWAANPSTVIGRPCGSYRGTAARRTVFVPTVRTLGTTCFAARALARRYLNVIGRPGLRKVTPYTCWDRASGAWRVIGCRAPTRRFVWFNVLFLPGRSL